MDHNVRCLVVKMEADTYPQIPQLKEATQGLLPLRMRVKKKEG